MPSSEKLPEILTSAERTSHLTRALHDLLMLPLPSAAMPALARIAWVAHLDITQASETIGDILGVEALTPNQDSLSRGLHLDGTVASN